MFELLLQADQALGQGQLDDAQRRYEQVLDLDPTNAIAVAGLARIAFERGDDENAGMLAQRALAMDPESVVAVQVARAILQGEPAVGPDEATARAEVAGQQLGAMGLPPRGPSGDPAGATAEATTPSVSEVPEIPPEPLPGMPSEPLRERGQIGRYAAAAAAAMNEQSRPIEAPRRVYAADGPGALDTGPVERRRPIDPFAMAEAAAAIEAVDAFDALDVGAEVDAAEVAQPGTEPPREVAGGGVGEPGEAGEAGEMLVAPALSEPAVLPRQLSRRPPPPSEQDAEAEALREALEIVLEAEVDAAGGEGSAASGSTEPRARTETDNLPASRESAEPALPGVGASSADEPAASVAAIVQVGRSAPAEPGPAQAPEMVVPAVTVPDAVAAEREVESALEDALAELLSNDTVWEVASSTHSRAPLARATHGRPGSADAGGPSPAGKNTPATPTEGVAQVEPAPSTGEQPDAKRRLPTDYRDSAPDGAPGEQDGAEPATTQKEPAARPRQKGLFGRFGGR